MRIVIDHGTEFTSKPLDQWAYDIKVTLHFITPGRPMENGYIEIFHGKFRDECLNEHWFPALDDARETIDTWRIELQPGAPTQLAGLPDATGIRDGLCKCGKQRHISHLHSPDGGCEQNLQLNSDPALSLTRTN